MNEKIPLIEEIYNEDVQLALIIRNEFNCEKNNIKFFTRDSFSQQIGLMNRPKDYEIIPHIHNLVKREVLYTNEVLFVKKGLIQVDFFDDNKVFLESRIIKKGDLILLIKGGHGFKFLEDSDLIEVKQGPYLGESDKSRFNKK